MEAKPSCEACDEPARSRCTGCSRVWYCSKRCQEKLWPVHMFNCNPNKPIKTSYYLARAARDNLLPEDAQTLEDYGFSRLQSSSDRPRLLGLYQGLLRFTDPKTLHNWRVHGTLVKEIKGIFESLPAGSRGQYYSWFLKHPYILDRSIPLPDAAEDITRAIIRAWRFTGGSHADTPEDIKQKIAQLPKSAQDCHQLYLQLLLEPVQHPSPLFEIWVLFGFCTCSKQRYEGELGLLYRRLIDKCTFKDFVAAYENDSLPKLMRSCGLPIEKRSHPYLEEFLFNRSTMKSVWWLKQLVEVSEAEVPDGVDFKSEPAVNVDYGFINCRNADEYGHLKALYKQVLGRPETSPLNLHEACIQGKLYEYIEKFVTLKRGDRERLIRILQNPHSVKDIGV